MISESIYWRRELYQSAAQLRTKTKQLNWRDASFYRAERELMLGCYAIRRLLESLKVPADLNGHLLPGLRLPARQIERSRFRFAPPIDLMVATQMFDFQCPQASKVKVRDFLNSVIHSYVLAFLPPAEGFVDETMVFVASDHERRLHLNCFWLSEIALLFEKAALLDVTQLTISWSAKHDDFRATTKGQLADRLTSWGFVPQSEMPRARARLKQHRNPAELSGPLTLLHESASEYYGS